MRTRIISALEGHLQSSIVRHVMNVEVMLDNPRAIPEHEDVMQAIEKELSKISEYNDKLDALKKYF